VSSATSMADPSASNGTTSGTPPASKPVRLRRVCVSVI
jgi:hypothetical protein